MSRIIHKGLYLNSLILLCIGLFGWSAPLSTLEIEKTIKQGERETASIRETEIVRVIDGDTLEGPKQLKIRLIGVDTPEKNHPSKPIQFLAQEATNFTKKMIEGKKVLLELGDEETDKYGRTLAYVYRIEDGKMLNAELIKEGLAYAYTKFPFRRKSEFLQCEEEAKKTEKGLWKNGGLDEFIWLQAQNRLPFEVWEMTNESWGIRTQGYFKLRIPNHDIENELANVRLWVNELGPADLAEKFIKKGWVKEK